MLEFSLKVAIENCLREIQRYYRLQADMTEQILSQNDTGVPKRDTEEVPDELDFER